MHEPLEPSSHGQTSRFRLLTIEASGDIHRALLSSRPSGLNVEIETASPGHVFETTVLYEPDVILLDFCLPADYGFQVARLLRELSLAPRLVFLDATVQPGNVRKALEVGAQGYWGQAAFLEQAFDALRDIVSGKPSFCPEAHRYVNQTARGLRFVPAEGC